MHITGVVDLGIDVNVWPWVWLVTAVVFALVELTVLAGSFVLLPFAVSAFAASVLGFYDVAIEIQWLVFLLGGAALFVVMYRWARRYAGDDKPLGVGADRLVGMVATVTVPITPEDADRRGRVRIMGEDWGAITDGPANIETGTHVLITAMRGTRVVVRQTGAAAAGEDPT